MEVLCESNREICLGSIENDLSPPYLLIKQRLVTTDHLMCFGVKRNNKYWSEDAGESKLFEYYLLFKALKLCLQKSIAKCNRSYNDTHLA